MKNYLGKIAVLLISVSLIGCNVSPFSPKNRQDVNNTGTIDDIKSNQNGIMADIGKLNQKTDIVGSKLHDIQEGLVNFKGFTNENSGVQILSGDGGLIFIFSVVVIGMLLAYSLYKEKKVNKILADQIKKTDDAFLHENIIKAAAYTNVEKNIYSLLYKN